MSTPTILLWLNESVDNVDRFLAGHPLRAEVDRARGY